MKRWTGGGPYHEVELQGEHEERWTECQLCFSMMIIKNMNIKQFNVKLIV